MLYIPIYIPLHIYIIYSQLELGYMIAVWQLLLLLHLYTAEKKLNNSKANDNGIQLIVPLETGNSCPLWHWEPVHSPTLFPGMPVV